MAQPQEFKGLARFRNRAKRAKQAMRGRGVGDGLLAGLRQGALIIAAEAQRNVTKGPPKHVRVRSGRLRQSIHVTQLRTGQLAAVQILVGAKYGKVHEFGMTIRPVRASRLRFKVDGKTVFARSVTIPKRPFLGPAVRDKASAAVRAVRLVYQGPLFLAGRAVG